jgi:AcrR family transcriptional regulator
MFNSTPSRERDAEARRGRLLKAAAVVFARDGFEKASLRAICTKAKANLAAVKYYFGSKEGLYREVLLECHREALAHEAPVTLADGNPPEDTLRRWIHFCLQFILFKRASNPLMGQIMAHELRQPTPCLNDFVKLIVRPFHEELRRIVAAVLGRSKVDEECMLLSQYIIGLCIHFDHGRAVINLLGPPVPKTEPEIQKLAAHIADFVQGALAATRARSASPNKIS